MNLRSLLGAVEPNCGTSWQVEMFVFHVDVGGFTFPVCRSTLPVSSENKRSGNSGKVYRQGDESGVGPYDDDGEGWALLVSGQSFPLLLP
jgi:hypothetical protein